jgi:hypothetical protein
MMSLIRGGKIFKQIIRFMIADLSGFCKDMTSDLTSVAGAWFLVQIP